MKVTTEFDPAYTYMTVELDQGESIKVEPGAMATSQGVEMHTGMTGGGLFGKVRRMVAGESFFVNTFTGGPSGGWIGIASTMPGDMKSFDIEPGQNLYIQGGSFLASDLNVELDTKFQGMRGMFSGENLFFLRAYTERGTGTIYCNCYGAIKELTVSGDQELVVDTGHLVAFTDGVEYSIGKVGGLVSLIGGGEGLVMKFRGEGKVWVQTRTIATLADLLNPLISKN